MFFIPLAVKRGKKETLADCQFCQWTRARHDRRSLVKVTVEGPKNPVEPWNFHRHAEAGICGVLHHVCREMGLANAGDERQPGGHLELVADKYVLESSRERSRG